MKRDTVLRVSTAALLLALLPTLLLTWPATVARAQEIQLQPGLMPGKHVYLASARDSAWCEIAVVLDSPSKEPAQLYNTTATTGPEGGCPEAAFAKLDGSELAAALNAEDVYMNPTPQIARRYWVMDELQVYRVGETANFRGVAATWVGAVPVEQVRNAVSAPYAGVEIHLESRFVYTKGSTVFLLRSPAGKTHPGGTTWVMQSYTTEVDAELTFEQLTELRGKLKLPPGWTFETQRLSKDLTVDPRNNYGTAHIVRDDLHNVYEGCGFDTACSYVP